MKKFFLILVFSASMAVYGQFNTGSIYFTGMTGSFLSYERISSEFGASNIITYDLHLEGGYFFRNRIAAGATLFTGGEHRNYFGIGATTGQHEFYLGPNVRYYQVRDDNLQLYFCGNPYFGLGTYGGTLGVIAGAGINYFLTERVSLDARGSYIFHHFFDEFAAENTHSLKFEIGITLFFPSITFFDMTN